MKARIGKEARDKRLKEMLELRDEYLSELKSGNMYKIKLMNGNSKTGRNCCTVSLIPIADCYNCSKCMVDCYDINTDCRFPDVKRSRAMNSALHMFDIAEYWRQISSLVKELFVTELRINVGGDLKYEDFGYVNQLAKDNPRTDILFFTKSYADINRWLSENGEFEGNVKAIISRWLDVPCANEHNLPESHVLYEDGRTTAPEYGAKYCGGNCSECHFNAEGCWTLKNGESVIFKAH